MATFHRRRFRTLPTIPLPADQADAQVRDHHRAIEAAAREFESWQSNAIPPDTIAVDRIRSALRAMLVQT